MPPLSTSWVRSLTVFSCLSLPILIWFNMLPGATTKKKVMLPNAEISIWKWNAYDKGRSLDIAIAFVNTIFRKPHYLKENWCFPPYFFLLLYLKVLQLTIHQLASTLDLILSTPTKIWSHQHIRSPSYWLGQKKPHRDLGPSCLCNFNSDISEHVHVWLSVFRYFCNFPAPHPYMHFPKTLSLA